MRYLVTGERVITGPVGQSITDGAVLIEDGSVLAVGPRSNVEGRAGSEARHLPFPGHTILPGLIDAHVHLAFDATAGFVDTLRGTDDDALLSHMAERARRLVRSGVTTCRDLGDRGGLGVRLRDAVARGELVGPRVLTAASPLTIPGGHCWFLGGEVAGDETSLRDGVRRTAEAGADLVKIMASGGQMTPNSPPMWESQFTAEQMRIVVEEATAAGLPVAAHAHGSEAIASAVSAGVATVEHCSWIAPGPRVDLRAEVAAEMASGGIVACPTMSAYWPTFGERVGYDHAEGYFQRIAQMDGLGIRVVPGTDAGVPGATIDDFVGALGVYEYVGFPLERIIELATASSAAALGVGDRTGTLRPGHDADLLVVDGDPLDELDALRRQAAVFARGVLVSPASPAEKAHP